MEEDRAFWKDLFAFLPTQVTLAAFQRRKWLFFRWMEYDARVSLEECHQVSEWARTSLAVINGPVAEFWSIHIMSYRLHINIHFCFTDHGWTGPLAVEAGAPPGAWLGGKTPCQVCRGVWSPYPRVFPHLSPLWPSDMTIWLFGAYVIWANN